MATSDNASLLSKVVSFVSGPVLRKPAGFEARQGTSEDADKATMQAMMERRLHNDVVRKREFELLRQMRKREPQVSSIDVNERTSLFPSSILTQPGGRAQTIKKIDEIEQQMSQQWWKGKQIKGAFQGSKPAPMAATPSASEVSTKPATAPPAIAPAVVPPATPPAVTASTKAARMEASLYDEPQPAASEFLPTQVDQFAHDPEMEDAAILFANGDFEAAAKYLLGLLSDKAMAAEQEKIWMTLFDLYRVTGDRTRFDGAGLDFAARFGRSAPQWGASPEVEQQQLAPDILVMSAGQAQQWTSPSTLGPMALNQLKDVLSKATVPWLLDWSQLVRVEDSLIPEMEGLFDDWCKSRLQLRFAGVRQLDELLRDATATGNAEVRQEWWLWRLSFLRLAGREDEFERVALDYCITYEMSPPSWEPPLADFHSSETDSKEAASGVKPLVMGEELLSTLAGGFSMTQPGTLEFPTGFAGREATAGEVRFGLVELSGEVLGDATVAIAKMDRGGAGVSKLVVDCQYLIRVDFLAAGDLLNWTSARAAEGRKVEFKNLNRLVATFFSVIGIDEFARIIPPAH